MTHELKTWPEYFQAIWDGRKRFEVRKNDRDYQEGDILILKETASVGKNYQYTGRTISCQVEYVLQGGSFGIQSGYCVMSIEVITKTP
jgi:ASC-1-like (ASCH) protein